MKTASRLGKKASRLKIKIYTLYLAYKDPRVPWYARAFIACVAAYALSPVDLIPDFIPVLGYLDDLVIIPLGISLAQRMIPREVMTSSRKKARALFKKKKPVSRIAGVIIIAIWLFILSLVIRFILKLTRP